MNRLLHLLLSSLLFVGVLLPGTPLQAKTVTLTTADNHSAVSLILGDTLVIDLPSPFADSYRWQARRGRLSALTPLNEDYTPPKGKGDEGAQSFRFNAAVAGATGVTLEFTRQKPGPAPAVTQTFLVEVTVASGEPEWAVLVGDYKGTLPCADCSGLQTELKLYAKGRSDFTEAIYIGTRTYVGGRSGDQSFTDRGEWTVSRGDATDPNATVYALSSNPPGQMEYWLVQSGGGALTQLDRQMKPIDVPTNMNLTLKKVN